MTSFLENNMSCLGHKRIFVLQKSMNGVQSRKSFTDSQNGQENLSPCLENLGSFAVNIKQNLFDLEHCVV